MTPPEWTCDGTLIMPRGDVEIDIRNRLADVWLTIKASTAANGEEMSRNLLTFLNDDRLVDKSEAVTNYWTEHYVNDHCTLCGNHGVIDTRATAVTAAGVWVGRVNFCICPNGQSLRAQNADPEHWLATTFNRK